MASQRQISGRARDRDASAVIRRQRVFLIVVGIAAVLAIGGLVGSLFVKSPSQQAAEIAPPTPSVLTAVVRQDVLTQSVVLRGTIASAGKVAVTGTLGRSAGPAIVTKLPLGAGSSVDGGQVLAEISGRPIFAMAGMTPAYRDITVGTVGPDVQQLQDDLIRLGFLKSGWGGDTLSWRGASALKAFVKDRGYAPTLDSAGYAMLPLAEVVFLPTTPATISAVNGSVGDNLAAAQQPLLTVTTGSLTATTTVPSGSETGLKTGQTVTLSDDVRGRTAPGKISSIGTFSSGAAPASGSSPGGTPSSSGAGLTASTPGFPLVIQPDSPLPSDWLGSNVRVTIDLGSSGASSLIVPVTAIATTADGKTSVTVLRDDGTKVVVAVAVGFTAAGNAAVTAPNGDLKAGDRVVVG